MPAVESSCTQSLEEFGSSVVLFCVQKGMNESPVLAISSRLGLGLTNLNMLTGHFTIMLKMQISFQ